MTVSSMRVGMTLEDFGQRDHNVEKVDERGGDVRP